CLVCLLTNGGRMVWREPKAEEGFVLRPRLCVAAAMFLVMIAAAFLAPGCGNTCQSACENNNDLQCIGTWDCDACSKAPAACDEFFSCVAGKDNCLDIGLSCERTAACDAFMAKHCH